MPFYEYECSACKYYLEVLQKISDAPLKKCPSCGKQSLTRLLSAPVFRLKGSGWYETDFKSDKEQKRNLAGEGEKESTEGESKSAEAKPAPEAAAPATAEAKPAKSAAKPKSASKPKAGNSKKTAKTKPAAKKAARR